MDMWNASTSVSTPERFSRREIVDMDAHRRARHTAAVETSEHPARILVIEDDEAVQALMSDVLRSVGHLVFVADNGRQGLTRYRDCRPDLVITDIFMPERNGLDVILELAPHDVKIIATSGGGD